MSFETTNFPLPQALIPICASYLTPPESRYIAVHQPADQAATALFAQFRAAYNSQAMWDHLAPSHGAETGANSRAGVTTHYQTLNTRVLAYINSDRLDHNGKPVPMPEGDPFLVNARLQGVLIRCLIGNPHNRAPFPPLERPVAAMVLHMAFSPMRGDAEVLAEDFYGRIPGAISGYLSSGPVLMGLDRDKSWAVLQHYEQWDGFLGTCLTQHGAPLFLEHGGRLTTQTLMQTIAQLLDSEADGDVVQQHLDLIKLHLDIDAIRTELNLFDLLHQMIEHKSSEIVCLLIKLLRDEIILRGLRIPEGPRQGEAFDDHYLLAYAQDKKNEGVVFMAEELIRKLKNASSERPALAEAGAAAAAAGAGAGAAAAAAK